VEVSHKEKKADTQKEKYTTRVLQRLQKWKTGKCIQVEKENIERNNFYGILTKFCNNGC